MKKNMYKICVLALLLLFAPLFPHLLMAQTENALEMADNLDLAYKQILQKLDSLGNFNNSASTLLVVSDAAGNTTAPLCAVMEREALVSFNNYGSFKSVKTSADLGFVYNGLNEDVLKRLDKLGIDRVLSISSALKDQRLLLTIRAIWLEGGSFAEVLKEPLFYPELKLSASVKESGNWVLLGRPSDVFTSQSERFTKKTLFKTQGKALDIAYGDVDGDGLGDIVLLLEKRLELWVGKNNGYSFRYSFDFSESEKASLLPRFVTGDVEVCRLGDNDTADVFFMTNQIKEGLRLNWENNRLLTLDNITGAPLACLNGNIVLGNYVKSSHTFDGKIRIVSEFGEQVTDTQKEFISAVPVNSGKDWLLIEANGKLYLSSEKRRVQNDCGIHPAITKIEGSETLACGISEVEPVKDAIRFLNVLMPSLKEVYRMDYNDGAIWGIASMSSWKGDAFFSVRYDESSNKSIVEKFKH